MSLIYSKANKQNIDNAVAKARQLKPRVTIDGFARFTVQGSQDDSYKVQFLKNEAGEFPNQPEGWWRKQDDDEIPF